MAQFLITTVVLFFFFTLSLSLTPPEHDDVAAAEVSLPLSAADPAITNPSVPVDEDPPSIARPLTTISFRPINRRFSQFPCRPHHHNHKFFKSDFTRSLRIPYGDETLVSSGENSDFPRDLEETLRGGSYVKLHRRHDEDSDSDSDSDSDDKDGDDRRVEKMRRRRGDFDGFDGEKKLKKLRKHFRRHESSAEEDKKKEKVSFMIRVRDFFDHLF